MTTIVVIPEKKVIKLTVAGPEYEEFRTLVQRAVNTWDTMPQWVRILSDTLEDNPSTDSN